MACSVTLEALEAIFVKPILSVPIYAAGSSAAVLAGLDAERKQAFRFHRVSTVEVYGDLHGTADLFTETTPMLNSPYSASKVSLSHLVRAGHRTYGLLIIVTNCFSNTMKWYLNNLAWLNGVGKRKNINRLRLY